MGMLFSCQSDPVAETIEPTETTSPPNILLIIADDMGKDATSGFDEGSDKPTTPHIDSIRNSGLTFTNFWAYPTCSPSRASIITGKYGYRTGVKWADDVMSSSETILHRYITEQTDSAYATALIGKWHLSGPKSTQNPEDLGMDYFAGIMNGAVPDYYNWRLAENGQESKQTEYATEKITDLSINWINEQEKPWFLWLAYNAPHTPFHVPPAEMHSQGDLPDYTEDAEPLPYYLAAIEAMDYQIGRLLENLSEEELANTVIIFLGDNGTPNQVAQHPFTRMTVKGTLYQGGVNTPMFISGPGISRVGEADDNLITGTDLFATISEIAGASISEINDSKSFKSLLTAPAIHRDFQYSEMNKGDGDSWAINDGQYKLITDVNGNEEMYNLSDDPYEKTNLQSGTLDSDQQTAKSNLENELSKIRD